MTDDVSAIPRFPAMRYALALLLLSLVGAVAVTIVLLVIDKEAQLLPSLSGLAVCTAGGLIALELVRRGARHSMGRLAVMCMAGTSARLGVTLLGGFSLVFLCGTDVRATAVWMLIWYVLLLVFEVKLLTRYLGSLSGAGAEKTFDIVEGRA